METIMKIIQYTDVEPIVFESPEVKGVAGRVVIGENDGAKNFCMRVMVISPEGNTPKHSHEWEHEIFFHSGSGEVFVGGSWKSVSAGSVVFVPENEIHQFRNTGNNDLIMVCLIPAGFPEL